MKLEFLSSTIAPLLVCCMHLTLQVLHLDCECSNWEFLCCICARNKTVGSAAVHLFAVLVGWFVKPF